MLFHVCKQHLRVMHTLVHDKQRDIIGGDWDSRLLRISKPPGCQRMRLSSAVQELAQRALVAYLRSIFLQPNKAVFNASALPAAEYALSMGLTSVPKLRFLKRHGPKKALKGI